MLLPDIYDLIQPRPILMVFMFFSCICFFYDRINIFHVNLLFMSLYLQTLLLEISLCHFFCESLLSPLLIRYITPFLYPYFSSTLLMIIHTITIRLVMLLYHLSIYQPIFFYTLLHHHLFLNFFTIYMLFRLFYSPLLFLFIFFIYPEITLLSLQTFYPYLLPLHSPLPL